MKRILPGLLSCFVCTAVLATNLQKSVDTIINQVDPKINMGIEVVDLNTGETLYQRNATKTFTPASNMKLFSEAAALLVLGPDYRFQSKLSTDANTLTQGTLQGSLYLYLPGDPSFTEEHLNALLSQLSTWGITRIQGNVVLVSTHNGVNAYAPGIVAKDLTYSYGAPLSPVMLDENRVMLTVNPAYRVGEPALVELDAPLNSIKINNQVKTAASNASCGIDFKMDGENNLNVRGCVRVGQSAFQQRIAIRNPLRYSQDMIKIKLANMHIAFNGAVVLGTLPANTLLIATHASKPITQLMADTLKPSDNLYADSMYLHAAARLHGGAPLDWQQAQPVVKNFLQQQTGINLQNAILIDGSGLSRQDLVTAEQTIHLLQYLHNRFPLAYEYIAALPVAGQDGTLQRRLKKPTQQGLIRAKTGSMTGIMSLSGYLYTANAHTLAFAIYINTLPGTPPSISGQYRSLVDTLCDFFLRQKPDDKRFAFPANPHARVAFQQQPSQIEKQHYQQAKWRRLEYTLKQSLKNQPVSVIFRGDQLILVDHGADVNQVWNILQNARKKFPFAIALHSRSSPNKTNQMQLLWVHTMSQDNVRTWTLCDAVG